MRGDPKRIATDDEMPADIPANTPGADKLRDEQERWTADYMRLRFLAVKQ